MVDVWESADDFQRFVQERIMPAVQQLGIAGRPDIQIYPTHAILNPRASIAAWRAPLAHARSPEIALGRRRLYAGRTLRRKQKYDGPPSGNNPWWTSSYPCLM